MNETRFAIRTVRDGRICLSGQEWKPDERWMPYDGRLDGLRMAFGRYRAPDGSYLPMLALWGTERAYHEGAEVDWPGPHCVDGKFVWDWWRPA